MNVIGVKEGGFVLFRQELDIVVFTVFAVVGEAIQNTSFMFVIPGPHI